MSLRDRVLARGIKYVLHFTQTENLTQILKQGLIPRAILEKSAHQATFNDPDRFDGQPQASCASIGHPNYKMFFHLRRLQPDQEWCVIGIKADVLWKKECAFCKENAASSNVTCIPIADRKGEIAFEKIFEEYDGKPSRDVLRLTPNFPTNPQAEILIFDIVEPELIVGALLKSNEALRRFKGVFPHLNLRLGKAAFSARRDYQHW